MNLTTDQINAIAAVIIIFVAAITGGTVKLTPEQVNTLIVAVLAIIGTITALLQNMQKTQVITAMTPGTSPALLSSVAAAVPAASWMMDDEVKKEVIKDLDPRVQAEVLNQVVKFESQRLTDYYIVIPGGTIHIQYGLIKSRNFDANEARAMGLRAEMRALLDANTAMLQAYPTLPKNTSAREQNAALRERNNLRIKELLEALGGLTAEGSLPFTNPM